MSRLERPPEPLGQLTVALSEGRWTRDFPITVEMAQRLGLPVTTNMPQVVYDVMDLYPQPSTRRPSVIYVPMSGKGEPKGQMSPAADSPKTAR